MNILQAAHEGMVRGVKELNLIKLAEEAGFAGVAKHTGVGYKTFGCGRCRTNTAYKFVHIINDTAYLACNCGWRKKVNV